VNLQLVDTSGQEDFDMIRHLSYAQANVFLLVFSIHHPISLANIKAQWVQVRANFARGLHPVYIPYVEIGQCAMGIYGCLCTCIYGHA